MASCLGSIQQQFLLLQHDWRPPTESLVIEVQEQLSQQFVLYLLGIHNDFAPEHFDATDARPRLLDAM